MDQSEPSPHGAARACSACRKYKRRCDKKLPSCSLCVRLARPCIYSERQTEGSLLARVLELEDLVTGLTAPGQSSSTSSYDNETSSDSHRTSDSSFLQIRSLFIDSDLRAHVNASAPTQDIPVPANVTHHLGDRSQMAHIRFQYFETVHTWMPIISKVRLERLAETTRHVQLRPDFALLLLSMKLVQEVPPNALGAVQAPLYVAAKGFSCALEIAGIHSLLKLQANLLITVYEMGHAIFPAAYMSIGHCATQAIALGIHNSTAPQILQPPRNWIDWEERQRVWWLVMILDRYITAGGDNRPLFTEDPNKSTHIPADDGAWDRGESVPPERLFISSQEDISVSPFARVAQAAHLLGQVIKHCNDDARDLRFVQEDVELLYQTIMALFDLLTKDRDSILRFYVAVAICLSALMKLSDHHSCDSFATNGKGSLDMDAMALAREITRRCQEIMTETITRIASFVQLLQQSLGQMSEDAASGLSPLFLHCIYRATLAFAWMGSASSPQVAEQYTIGKMACMELLQLSDVKWKTAGAYLEGLELVERDLELGQY